MIVAATERLVLSSFELPDHLEEAHRLWSDPRVMAHVGLPHRDLERTRQSLEAAIRCESESGFCLWRLCEEREPIGCAGFLPYDGPGSQRAGTRWLELGYHLRPEAWGRGLATEAARACLELAAERGVTHVVARASAANAASLRVLAKLGFGDDGVEAEEFRFVLPLRK